MSELKTEEEKAAEQRRGPAAARRGGPPHLQIGVPTEKSQDFVPSAKRVLALLHPERFIVWTVVVLAVASALLGMAIGLLLSLFARTEFQAVQFLPAVVLRQVLLCGLFACRDAMIAPLRWLSDAFPLIYAVEAGEGSRSRGPPT